MIAGPLLKIEDVLQTITIFNMDDGRKNVFSITVSMLKIMGPIFTFKNGRKKYKYMKLGYVNVWLANMRSMLNNESFLGSFLVDFEFYHI